MFDYSDVSIVRKDDYTAVYSGDKCVNFGNRPVDHNFGQRIEDTLIKQGWSPVSHKGETNFRKGE